MGELNQTAKAKEVERRSHVEELLEVAAEAQTAYWNAVNALEEASGYELDGEDLRDMDVDTLLGEEN